MPPPVPASELGFPLSGTTGEPARPPVLLLAIGFAWLSAVGVIAAYAAWWWRSAGVVGFPTSARLMEWTKPDPVSALAIVLVIAIGLIGLLMVAAAGTVAYNAWAGARWIRVGGLVALAVQCLSFLVNWWFSAAMIPLAVAVALFWFPRVKAFLAAMAAKDEVPPIVVPTTGIAYGPQPLI